MFYLIADLISPLIDDARCTRRDAPAELLNSLWRSLRQPKALGTEFRSSRLNESTRTPAVVRASEREVPDQTRSLLRRR
jgi:hypothetical protein